MNTNRNILLDWALAIVGLLGWLLLGLSIGSANSRGETIEWIPNSETNIVGYVVDLSDGVRTNSVPTLSTNCPFAPAVGVTYTIWVRAVNDEKLESPPSEPVTFRKFPPPPPVNITGRPVIGGYDRRSDLWLDYRVTWDSINLTNYGATNYTLTVALPGVTGDGSSFVVQSPTNGWTFATLQARDYLFSVTVIASGTSPAGSIYLQSGKHPQNPVGVVIKQ